MTNPNRQNFSLTIVDPNNTLFEGEVKKVFAPGLHQKLAILPDHTPLYAQLVKGDIDIFLQNNKKKTFTIESGIIRVKLNKVTIITGFDSQGNVKFA